ncbi:MAG: double-strand break repair helicase AddA [Alphaproteobacteria bacterium]|nr:double-strand break repair helicase AddA [Alphaproteobacteria bacterium]
MSQQHSTRPRATLDQSAASHPKVSSWVTASAGTGKTQVLTDRVLRLLLAGTPARALLCLTFTRAAAAVMRVRVTEALVKWATAPDHVLVEDLQLMRRDSQAPTPEEMRVARRLFTDVLDEPGGLRIVTIHAFCESLLARFPIESGVAAHFTVMDERTAAEHLEAARDRVLERARNDPRLAAKVGGVTSIVTEQRLGELMAEMAKHRSRIEALTRPGLAAGVARVRECLGLEEGEAAAGILRRACADGAFDALGLERLCREMAKTTTSFAESAGVIQAWLRATPAQRADQIDAYLDAFFTEGGNGKRRGEKFIAKATIQAHPELRAVIEAEMDRLEGARERLHKATVFDATECLLTFGVALLDEYQRRKERLALLDYDDLILKACALLEREGIAPWVLYKLDGGVDHILIDEAQDTSPAQWRVIKAIADEFFAGRGAYEGREQSAAARPRTIFAVGDAKQSIYSFLQADPESFRRMRGYFGARVAEADAEWRPQDLAESFRSVAPILQAVDAVFETPPAQDGMLIADTAIRHNVARTGQAGYVEVWPTVCEEETEPGSAWDPPREQQYGRSASAAVAERIARTVQAWIGTEVLPARGRTVRPGDILILVQRRGTFVEEVVRALKSKRVPVAGTDRMLITEQLPVQDLMALGRFVLLPEDNLNLAALLKSPLIGISEEDLYDLAAGRDRSLWATLRGRAGERPTFAAAERTLLEARSAAAYTTPHGFYAGLLAKGGRLKILRRLGPEANDPVDEFLAQALEYERTHPPSLEGFLDWIVRGQVVVARDLEVGRDEVRVLTVHGAKGLQAPIVFLADTYFIGNTESPLRWHMHGGIPVMLWVHLVKNADSVLKDERAQAKALRVQEYHRLLYVAMTRAEDRLIVCGFAPARPADRDARCWYGLIDAGLKRMKRPPVMAGDAQRWESEQSAAPDGGGIMGATPELTKPLPAWAFRPAPTEPVPKSPLAPSRPYGVEPAAHSPLAGANGNAGIRRGVLIHRLLQLLPGLAADQRRDAAARFLAANAAEFAAEARGEMLGSTLAVLEKDDFAPLFGPNSRAEVPLVGSVRLGGKDTVLAGQVDRLVVAAGHVLVVDYKTNRPAPTRLADVPPVYRQQMAAYRAGLVAIYPGREIRCALLWTDGPRLMELPESALTLT